MYRNYIFDLYGTLVDIRTDEERAEVWEKLRLFYGYYGAVYEAGELRACYRKLVEDKIRGGTGGIGHTGRGDRDFCGELVKGREESGIGGEEYIERESEIFCGELVKDREESGMDGEEYAGKGYEACPEIKIEQVFSELFALKGVRAGEELAVCAGQFFRVLSTEHIGLYEGARELLERLKERGKRLYLLSNAQRIFTAYEMELLKIAGYFDGIFLSSDFGIKKPERQFFERLISQYDLDVRESIMIGNDEVCDIAGAWRAGFNTCYIHTGISPEYTGMAEPTYRVMEPDFEKVYEMICGEGKWEGYQPCP